MSQIATALPDDNAALRTGIYAGQIYRIPASGSSFKLAQAAAAIVKNVLGADYRHAQFRLSRQEFISAIRVAKAKIYEDPAFALLMAALVTECGFTASQYVFDPPRLRAVSHNGHDDENAWAAYTEHRDTWYANPQCQLNFWMPLHDVAENETFSFFPGYFKTAIANTSADFDFLKWSAEVGFGNSAASKQSFYPTITTPLPADAERLLFNCKAAELLLFSAAQLHATNKNVSGQTRFSLDFRLVHLQDDATGIGAPNVDNFSTGSAMAAYRSLLPANTADPLR